jgi:DNA polymerase elongation subunit (family B)
LNNLAKTPDDYAIKTTPVQATNMLKKKLMIDWSDKVRYVILDGKVRLYSQVKPHLLSKPNEMEIDYYITNQLLPA